MSGYSKQNGNQPSWPSHQDFAEGARLRQVPASESKLVNNPEKFNLVIKVFIFHFNLRKEGRKGRREREREGGKEGKMEEERWRQEGRKEKTVGQTLSRTRAILEHIPESYLLGTKALCEEAIPFLHGKMTCNQDSNQNFPFHRIYHSNTAHPPHRTELHSHHLCLHSNQNFDSTALRKWLFWIEYLLKWCDS